MKEKSSLVFGEKKARLAFKETPSPYCCPHVLSKLHAMKRRHECIPKANFICYNLNFQEKNGMQGKLGCLRVRQQPTKPSEEFNKKLQIKVPSVESYNIPNITLPSLKEILEYPAVSSFLLVHFDLSGFWGPEVLGCCLFKVPREA